MIRPLTFLTLIALATAGCGGDTTSTPDTAAADAAPLTTRVSVSGLSSGGYMATQFAVAYSASIDGLGVAAAGPWGCAQGKLQRALKTTFDKRDQAERSPA